MVIEELNPCPKGWDKIFIFISVNIKEKHLQQAGRQNYSCPRGKKALLYCLLGQTFLLCKQILNNLGFETIDEEVPGKRISTTESYSKFIKIWILRNRHWDH